MGLGETQVFQDEKSRLANTTVARIVAAKGSFRGGGATPGDDPGDLSARGRAGLAPARPRAEHGPGDDGHRARGRRPRRPIRSTSAGRATAARAALPLHGARPRRLNA